MRRAVHRDEAETLVELDRLLVDWLDRDDRAADFFPRLHDIAKRRNQQAGAEAVTLKSLIDCEAGNQRDRLHRLIDEPTADASGQIIMRQCGDGELVVARDHLQIRSGLADDRATDARLLVE